VARRSENCLQSRTEDGTHGSVRGSECETAEKIGSRSEDHNRGPDESQADDDDRERPRPDREADDQGEQDHRWDHVKK
jgi:hypothetical protein